jgi:octaprenyl-diphosphate synthase
LSLKELTLDEIYAPIAHDLEETDTVYAAFLNSFPDPVGPVTKDLVHSSRKRLRPALVFLSADLGRPNRLACRDLACASELLHSASLVHDDIVDESELRRKQPALHIRWKNKVSILAGDLLYAKAFGLISALNQKEVSQFYSNAVVEMCRGEIRELLRIGRFELEEEEYLKIIEQKTASLLGACTASGALLGGLSETDSRKLFDYGLNLGMGFQITDDVLDFEGEVDEMGKNAGTDSSNGMLTLPLIYCLRQEGVKTKKRLEELFQLPPKERHQPLRDEVMRSGGLDYARELAHHYADRSKEALGSLSQETSVKENLIHLTNFTVARSF